MSAIGRVTRATTEMQRVDRGENRLPAVWRARVVYIREAAADCGHRPGVYITVPNFTRNEIHGPVQVVGDTPADGDSVVAVAVEGRKNDWIIITPSGMADLEKRLSEVEQQTAATRSQLEVLDNFVEHHVTARIGAVEWDVEQLESTVNAIPGIEVDTSAGTRVSLGGQVIYYDSGWRDVTELYLSSNMLSGSLHLRRTLTSLFVRLDDVQLPEGSGFTQVAGTLPQRWRLGDSRGAFVLTRSNNSSYRNYFSIVNAHTINWIGEGFPQSEAPATGVRPPVGLTGTVELVSQEALPTSLIGDPA